mmetsp:Transcript_9776/g.23768  ORF Transcript_9776/g.23768 Transcript_9776/m.23768 type:complete len:210 (-) Transcript_9776:195-824(-)
MTTGGRGAPQRAVWLIVILLVARAAEAAHDVRAVADILGSNPIVELSDHRRVVFVPIAAGSIVQLADDIRDDSSSRQCIETTCWALCHNKAPDVITSTAVRLDMQCSKMWQKVGVFEDTDMLRAEDAYSHLIRGAQFHALPREFRRLAYFEPSAASLVLLHGWEAPVVGYPSAVTHSTWAVRLKIEEVRIVQLGPHTWMQGSLGSLECV